MKFFFDNNISPSIARGINELCQPYHCSAVALRDKFEKDTNDIDWLLTLKSEGNWVIISQDRFVKNNLEKEAFYRGDSIAFIFAKGWVNLKYWEKAAKMVKIWPKVIEQANLATSGVFEIPVNSTKFKQAKL